MKYLSNCASADKITIWVLQYKGTLCGAFFSTTIVFLWFFKMNNILWEWESLSFLSGNYPTSSGKMDIIFSPFRNKIKIFLFLKEVFSLSQARNYFNVLSAEYLPMEILEWRKHSTYPPWRVPGLGNLLDCVKDNRSNLNAYHERVIKQHGWKVNLNPG